MELHPSNTFFHAKRSLALSKDPPALAALRGDLLDAIGVYLMKFEIARDPAQLERWQKLRDQVYATAERIRQEPLQWFADWHEWNRVQRPQFSAENNAAINAGLVLKLVGKIGK
jgi:hypothetical protein